MSESGENSIEKDISFTLEVSNKMGIHARPAAMIVRIASRFEGDIWVEKEGERVNAKSIMEVLMLAANKNTNVLLEADGADEKKAVLEIEKLFNNYFGEGE